MRLLLASASPRRAELLAAAGFDFEVQPADVDEAVRPGETPLAYVCRVAEAKAAAVLNPESRIPNPAPRVPNPESRNGIVVAADTVVVVDQRILGKPADRRDAVRMLRLLSGRRHEVLTAVTAVRASQARLTRVQSTVVELASLSNDEIDWYVGTGEPFDKAGAYAVQGLASRFVTRIEGSYSNVVGLPIALVYAMLRELAGPEV